MIGLAASAREAGVLNAYQCLLEAQKLILAANERSPEQRELDLLIPKCAVREKKWHGMSPSAREDGDDVVNARRSHSDQ